MFLMVCVWKANMFIYQTHRNEKLRWNTNETNFFYVYLPEILKQWFEIDVMLFPKGIPQST